MIFFDVLSFTLAALALAYLVGLGVHQTLSKRHLWHPWESLRGPVMRRRVGLKWETRDMTPAEFDDWRGGSAW
jgi:hypothetical protein